MPKKMFTLERQNKILEMLNTRERMTIQELSDVFGVSVVTIRKDINELCEAGLAIRMHGGVMKSSAVLVEFAQEEKIKKSPAEKQAIARLAIREIHDGETIMLYGGTTLQALAEEISRHEWSDLTVITNAINIASILKDTDGIQIDLIGGKLRKRLLTCIGPMAEYHIKQLVADKVFVSANCISEEYGLMASTVLEGTIVQCMLQSGLKKYALMDSQKFEQYSTFRICNIDELHVLITDSNLSPDLFEKYRLRGCHIMQAPLI